MANAACFQLALGGVARPPTTGCPHPRAAVRASCFALRHDMPPRRARALRACALCSRSSPSLRPPASTSARRPGVVPTRATVSRAALRARARGVARAVLVWTAFSRSTGRVSTAARACACARPQPARLVGRAAARRARVRRRPRAEHDAKSTRARRSSRRAARRARALGGADPRRAPGAGGDDGGAECAATWLAVTLDAHLLRRQLAAEARAAAGGGGSAPSSRAGGGAPGPRPRARRSKTAGGRCARARGRGVDAAPRAPARHRARERRRGRARRRRARWAAGLALLRDAVLGGGGGDARAAVNAPSAYLLARARSARCTASAARRAPRSTRRRPRRRSLDAAAARALAGAAAAPPAPDDERRAAAAARARDGRGDASRPPVARLRAPRARSGSRHRRARRGRAVARPRAEAATAARARGRARARAAAAVCRRLRHAAAARKRRRAVRAARRARVARAAGARVLLSGEAVAAPSTTRSRCSRARARRRRRVRVPELGRARRPRGRRRRTVRGRGGRTCARPSRRSSRPRATPTTRTTTPTPTTTPTTTPPDAEFDADALSLRENDQRCLTRQWLVGAHGAVAVEVRGDVFLSLANGTDAGGAMAHLDAARLGVVADARVDDARARRIARGGARAPPRARSPLGGVRAPVVLHGNGPAGKRLLAKLAAELEAAGWPPPFGDRFTTTAVLAKDPPARRGPSLEDEGLLVFFDDGDGAFVVLDVLHLGALLQALERPLAPQNRRSWTRSWGTCRAAPCTGPLDLLMLTMAFSADGRLPSFRSLTRCLATRRGNRHIPGEPAAPAAGAEAPPHRAGTHTARAGPVRGVKPSELSHR